MLILYHEFFGLSSIIYKKFSTFLDKSRLFILKFSSPLLSHNNYLYKHNLLKFECYVNLWYNKIVTKNGSLEKKEEKNMKRLITEPKKRLLFVGAILLVICLGILMVCFLNKETSKEQIAYEYLLKNGDLSPEQAIGIVANIRKESNFDTSVHEDAVHSTGLMCWAFGREEQLSEFAEAKGEEVTSFYLQLDFILEELSNSSEFANYQLMNFRGYTIEDWEDAQSPEDAALIFAYLYGRPGNLNETHLRDLATEIAAEVPSFTKGSQVL